MGSIVGIVVVVIGILASVALHEVGHMLPAKKFGVLVPDYAVGFGPALWKKKFGDTTYALRAILLGGYVKIVGMYAPARPGTRLVGRGGKPTLAQEAREASAEEIPQGQEHRAFYRLSAPKKIAVMLGGPLMNLLICIVLSAVTMIGMALPRLRVRLRTFRPRSRVLPVRSLLPRTRPGFVPGTRFLRGMGSRLPPLRSCSARSGPPRRGSLPC